MLLFIPFPPLDWGAECQLEAIPRCVYGSVDADYQKGMGDANA